MTFTSHELTLLENTDVAGYISAKNAARNAQAKVEGWQFWTNTPEDAEFVSQFANVYELELFSARGTYYDMHREVYNYRPTAAYYESLTLEELDAEIAEICSYSEREAAAAEREREWEADLEKRNREEIALRVANATPTAVLEEWEIYEAMAEAAGY